MTVNHSYEFSACFVQSFLKETGISEAERHSVLQAAGISPGIFDGTMSIASDPMVSEEQFAVLFKHLTYQLEDELPGLLSKPLRCGAMKYAALSVITAPTLAVALRRLARYLNLVIPDFEVSFEPGDTSSAIVFTETETAGTLKSMAFALMFKMLHGLASWLVEHYLPVERVNFSFRPPAYANDLRQLFPGEVCFGAEQSELIISSRLLELAVLRSPMDLRGFLDRQPQEWLSTSFPHQTQAQRVREYLAQADLAVISVEDTCQHLGISKRSLSRRLKEENTSFQQVKDGLRFDFAVARLTQTDAPLAKIAEELGFSDASSFNRAFRTWTGVAPGSYRQHRRRSRTCPAMPTGTQEAVPVEERV
jgi:AraC-like DNA-binding protein